MDAHFYDERMQKILKEAADVATNVPMESFWSFTLYDNQTRFEYYNRGLTEFAQAIVPR